MCLFNNNNNKIDIDDKQNDSRCLIQLFTNHLKPVIVVTINNW